MEKVNLKPGFVGDWKINRYKVEDLGCCYTLTIDDNLVPGARGVFTRLSCLDQVIMTDTPAEMVDHQEALDRATGAVLITGLGIGMLLKNILKKKEVSKIIVVEKNLDVINLVGWQYQDERLQIIHADAFEYQPDMIFDIVWHDIWPDVFVENLMDMWVLERKYRPYAKWQDFWARKKCLTSLDTGAKEQEDLWRASLIFEEVSNDNSR
jgi:hypothetical protein